MDQRHLRSRTPPLHAHAALMWLFTALFGSRVLAQLVQHWFPQSFLPPFHAFQGSNLPYSILLSAQILILTAMIRYSWYVQMRKLSASLRTGLALLVGGGIYMTGSLARLAIGLTVHAAPAWFSAWISGVFHLVIAGFVLTLAACYLRSPYLKSPPRPLTQISRQN